MATHSSILSWRIPWTEEPDGLRSVGSQKSWALLSPEGTHTQTHTHTLSLGLAIRTEDL